MKISPRLLAAKKGPIINRFAVTENSNQKQGHVPTLIADFDVNQNPLNMVSEQSKEMFAPLNSINAPSSQAI